MPRPTAEAEEGLSLTCPSDRRCSREPASPLSKPTEGGWAFRPSVLRPSAEVQRGSAAEVQRGSAADAPLRPEGLQGSPIPSCQRCGRLPGPSPPKPAGGSGGASHFFLLSAAFFSF
jgi:hypothetical protein